MSNKRVQYITSVADVGRGEESLISRRLTLNDVVLMDISRVCVFVNRVAQTTEKRLLRWSEEQVWAPL